MLFFQTKGSKKNNIYSSRGKTRFISREFFLRANANHKADSASGGYLRRLMRNGKSKKEARKATAHRLGTQIYNIMKLGQSYVEKGAADYEKAFEEKKIKSMTKALNELGYNVTKKIAA